MRCFDLSKECSPLFSGEMAFFARWWSWAPDNRDNRNNTGFSVRPAQGATEHGELVATSGGCSPSLVIVRLGHGFIDRFWKHGCPKGSHGFPGILASLERGCSSFAQGVQIGCHTPLYRPCRRCPKPPTLPGFSLGTRSIGRVEAKSTAGTSFVTVDDGESVSVSLDAVRLV